VCALSGGRYPTQSGQTTISKPVSQSDPDLTTGVPRTGRWRPDQIGQERTLDSRTQIVDTFVFSGARNALDESAEEDW